MASDNLLTPLNATSGRAHRLIGMLPGITSAKTSFVFLALLICVENSHRRSGGGGNFQDTNSQTSHTVLEQIELPGPTGPLAIATKTYNWMDHSRTEKASHDSRDFRQLIVQVWYPTKDESGPTAPYVPKLPAYRQVWDDAEVEVAGRVMTHSRMNKKPLSAVKFPIVLFSHGWQGTRSEYTSIAEDLASRGYAVFGIDHPYMGRVVLPNNHVTEPTEDQFNSPTEIRDYYGKDLQFAIDEISKLDAADPDGTFTGRLRLSRIAAIGHSSGFVAAATACKLDLRISACVNVDAPGFSASELIGLNQPLLWIRLEKAGPVPTDFLKSTSSPVYELRIVGANHGSVEDWDYLEAKSSLTRSTAAMRLQLIRRYLAGFLGAYLKDQNSDLLKHNSDSAELTFTAYRSVTHPN
jgi:pimeloyl-ACP methyl ester carboxylesterase